MADKAISELVRASIITAADLFVLQQDNTAKCLPGQVLLNWLTAAADGHGGIADWKKIGTSGLVDTYRVTLADTTTFDYYVTNGKAISSVKQTSVSGLTRTYTIAFNDGTTQQFTVTDGRGILSVEQTSVSGLTRTYTISFNDGTDTSFEITDGRSFVRMEKTGTNGLVDTYTITCNDGSTETLTVTNGEKGDKGDRADIWVRYASQKPTESSHSFGELPDTWIGIATGHNMDAAPTDWRAYDWFQWKGEKGDTGEPAERLSVTTAYQVGDAGNIIPSGSWLASIPYVAPGKYLWIRKTTVWNKGDPDVDYSVSRMGLDGTGAVSTVAGIGPDANGNVPLTAEDIKALPTSGGTMSGGINMNGQKLFGLNAPISDNEATTKGYVDQTRTVAQGGTGKTSLTSGNFLVGNGTEPMVEKTPDQVRTLIKAGYNGETLWEGTWNSGSITVTGSGKYNLFRIALENQSTAILAPRLGNAIRGIGGTTYDASYIQTIHVNVSVSGDTWTLTGADYFVHNVNGGHGDRAKLSVVSIHGLC